MKRVVLVCNRLMHYRVPVYNFLRTTFEFEGYDFSVQTTELQEINSNPIEFPLRILGLGYTDHWNALREARPDCVILFAHLKDLFFWPLIHQLKIHRIPVVVWTKGVNLDNPDDVLSRTLYRYIHRISDGLILYSPHEMRHIKPRHHHKISVAPNTLNHHTFPKVTESVESIKKDWNIPFDKIALFVGRMGIRGGRKRVDYAIEVFRRLENPRYGLLIVGSGFPNELQNMMNPVNTRYLGEIHDEENVNISRIMKIADIALIPGHVGLGLNQAFFWGLPVVTAHGDQPPEFHYLVDGHNGFAVPEGDLNMLTQQVNRLFNDDALLKRMSHQARVDFHQTASIERMAQGFVDAVGRLIAL